MDGTDEGRLAAFRQTRLEITSRLGPFVEEAIAVVLAAEEIGAEAEAEI